MKIVLIRHGSTEGNTLKRYIGVTDEPLCELGIRQAQAAGEDESVTQVWVSSLVRTRQTAALLFPKAQIIEEKAFDEMNFGAFEGKNYSELENDPRYRQWVEDGCTSAPPEGESRADFSDRVCRAFEKIAAEQMEKGAYQTVMVVHGGTVMAVLERCAEPKKDYFTYALKNCRGYICDCQTDPSGKPKLTVLSKWN